jgi:hypothetical protein
MSDDFPPVPFDVSLLQGAPVEELAEMAYDRMQTLPEDDGIVEPKNTSPSTNWTLVWVVVGIVLAVILFAALMYRRNRK